MTQNCPNRCDSCGKVYPKKVKEAFAEGAGSITCTGGSCRVIREFLTRTTAVLLQPGIVETHGETGLVIVSSGHNSNKWTLPGGCIRVNESAEDTLERIAKETLGITLNPRNLHDFCAKSNPKRQEHLSFYINTTRIHSKRFFAHRQSNTSRMIQIIQTTDEILFDSSLYHDVAEKFLLELWGRRPLP